MPSQHTQWSKDQRLIQYLDLLRQRNLEQWSYCHRCPEKAIGITAVKEKLYPACKEHGGEDVS